MPTVFTTVIRHSPFFDVASNRVKILPRETTYVRLCAGFSDAGIDEASHGFENSDSNGGRCRLGCVVRQLFFLPVAAASQLT